MSPEQVNAWRVFPRIFFTMYSVMAYKAFIWYTSLPFPEQTTQNASFSAAIIAAWFTWFAFYVNSGKTNEK